MYISWTLRSRSPSISIAIPPRQIRSPSPPSTPRTLYPAPPGAAADPPLHRRRRPTAPFPAPPPPTTHRTFPRTTAAARVPVARPSSRHRCGALCYLRPPLQIQPSWAPATTTPAQIRQARAGGAEPRPDPWSRPRIPSSSQHRGRWIPARSVTSSTGSRLSHSPLPRSLQFSGCTLLRRCLHARG